VLLLEHHAHQWPERLFSLAGNVMADHRNCLVGRLIELHVAQSARNKQLLSTDLKHDILYLLRPLKLLSFAVM